jgi:DNA-binding CsgD family transcriptional regulator
VYTLESLKRHPFVDIGSSIATTTAELCRKTPIHIMNFMRVYQNGRVVYLCDNPAWLSNYFLKKYPIVGVFEQHARSAGEAGLPYLLWSMLKDNDPVVLDSREQFNIHDGITLIKSFEGGHDYFNFGSFLKNDAFKKSILSYYHYLDQFTEAFYQKMRRALVKLEKDAVDIEQLSQSVLKKPADKRTRMYLGSSFDGEYLTPSELKCLSRIVKGEKVPVVAKRLFLSERTVESHLHRIKQKLRCKTQCELGFKAAQLNLELD